MGIIKSYRKENRNSGQYREPEKKERDNNAAKILDLSYLKKLIEDVLVHHKTKESSKKLSGYRRWSYVHQLTLKNVLGYVDTPTWVFMLEGMIEWCIENHSAVQPNGKWELCAYEYDVESKERRRMRAVGRDQDGRPQTMEISEDVQQLVIGMEFVDINGQTDVQYDMGRPRSSSESQITPAMLKDILANQNSKVVDDESSDKVSLYKETMKDQQTKIAQQDAALMEMQSQMSTMQDMMAGLITELQTAKNSDIVEETKPKPKKGRGK